MSHVTVGALLRPKGGQKVTTRWHTTNQTDGRSNYCYVFMYLSDLDAVVAPPSDITFVLPAHLASCAGLLAAFTCLSGSLLGCFFPFFRVFFRVVAATRLYAVFDHAVAGDKEERRETGQPLLWRQRQTSQPQQDHTHTYRTVLTGQPRVEDHLESWLVLP